VARFTSDQARCPAFRARELPNVTEHLDTLENRLRHSAVPRDVGRPFYLMI
jgi:hypothetical protein